MRYRKYMLVMLMLLSLVLLLTGCRKESAEGGWAVWGDARGAFSEDGYYYTSKYGCLYFFDVSNGNSVCLCSKFNCSHDSDLEGGSRYACDAYLGVYPFNGFFRDGRLYYVTNDALYGPYLYRRNADGTGVQKLFPLGHDYISQDTSVEIYSYQCVGNWLFYELSLVKIASDESGGTVFTKANTLLMRMDLLTGTEELLLSVDADVSLKPRAVGSNSVIYSQLLCHRVTEGEDRQEVLKPYKIQVMRLDLNTKESKQLLEAAWGDGLSILTVKDDKLWYTMGIGEQGACRQYDLKTGKDTVLFPASTLTYINEGFGIRLDEGTGQSYLVDMKTGKDLPTEFAQDSLYVQNVSDKGVVILRTQLGEGTSVKGRTYFYYTFESLKDGLQETDGMYISGYIKEDDVTTTPSKTAKVQYLPEKVDNPENLPVLKWLCVRSSSGNTQTYAEDAAVEINRVLEEKGMSFRLQFVILQIEDYSSDWITTDEASTMLAEADLIYADMYAEQAKQYMMPITQYTNGTASPSLENAVPHEAYWNYGRFDGEIYGIVSSTKYLKADGWYVDDAIFSQYGLTETDFQKQFWEMDDVFAQIFEKYNQTGFLFSHMSATGVGYSVGNLLKTYKPGRFTTNIATHFHLVGSVFAIDYTGDTPKVINYLETDYTRSCQAALKRYWDAGYFTEDVSKYLIQYSPVFCDEPNLPDGENYTQIPVEQSCFAAPVGAGTITGISATAKYPQEALALLALMADDEAFRELLLFGVEGKDYSLTETGGHTTLVRSDGTYYNMSFLSPFASLYGTENGPRLPAKEGSTKLETHREMIENSAVQIPIYFDFAPVAEELTAVNAILERLEQKSEEDPPVLFARYGQLTEAEYDEMLAEIQAAGSDKIIAELQRQLDAWLAANPDWNQ